MRHGIDAGKVIAFDGLARYRHRVWQRTRGSMVALGAGLILQGGCPSNRSASDSAGDSAARPAEAATGDHGDASDTTTEGDASTPVVEISVDDGNRFVKEDLDRFMKRYPDVMREQDAELFRSCVGDACLEHGVSQTVTPFVGKGVRYLVPLWLRGCLGGSAKACLYAGRTYQGSQYTDPMGAGVVHEGLKKQDLQARFRRYIDRACKLDERQCEQWADYTLGDDAPSPRDVELAVRRLEEGCSRKEHGACAALARHAPEHPSIGSEKEWWRQACEHDPQQPGRSCANYAARLLESGNALDRAKAREVLGPTCDPESDAWAAVCKGDPATGEEACDPTFLHMRGHICVQLAKTLPGAEALRLYAAMCVGSLLDETNAIAGEACEQAARLAKRRGASDGFRSAIARRRCEVDEMTCLSTTYNLAACDEKRAACEAAAGP